MGGGGWGLSKLFSFLLGHQFLPRLLELVQVGEKLFAAGFVEHRGFLPVSVMTSEALQFSQLFY